MKKLVFLFLVFVVAGCGKSGIKIEEIKHPITVGVLYFENTSKSEEYKDLSKGLVDMFITELGKSPELSVVERERLEKLMKELKLDQSVMVDPLTAQKIGKLVGAQALYYGGFMVMMGQLQLNGHLFRVETGELMASSGNSCEDVSSIKVLGEMVRNISKDIRAQIKKNHQALLADIYYSRGQNYEQAGDIQKALEEYEKALALKSNHRLSIEAKKRLAEKSVE